VSAGLLFRNLQSVDSRVASPAQTRRELYFLALRGQFSNGPYDDRRSFRCIFCASEEAQFVTPPLSNTLASRSPGRDDRHQLIDDPAPTQTSPATALEQLRQAFGDDWEAVRTAPLDAIKAASGKLACTTKAPRIVATLSASNADRRLQFGYLASCPCRGAHLSDRCRASGSRPPAL
jgi:hypothetical protein